MAKRTKVFYDDSGLLVKIKGSKASIYDGNELIATCRHAQIRNEKDWRPGDVRGLKNGEFRCMKCNAVRRKEYWRRYKRNDCAVCAKCAKTLPKIPA
jgi:hypothetical protein